MRILTMLMMAQATAATPALAQDHSGHAAHTPQQAEVAAVGQATPEEALISFRSALEGLDGAAMTRLFADEAVIVENGKAEGTFAEYFEHHLGPELKAIKSFRFIDPTIDIVRQGEHMAMGMETYRYRIELADGRAIERRGSATSVLMHDAVGWKILRYHSSSRPAS